MPTYSQTMSGGVYGAGSGGVTSREARTVSGGVYGAGAAGTQIGGTHGSNFITKFFKGGAAYVKLTDGSYRRARITEFHESIWGDGYYETNLGVNIEYRDTTLWPEAYLEHLNIVYTIDTKDRYYRYLNDMN